jgi:hypothetical protein
LAVYQTDVPTVKQYFESADFVSRRKTMSITRFFRHFLEIIERKEHGNAEFYMKLNYLEKTI